VKKSDEEDRTLVQKMRRFWEDPMLSISRQKAEDHDAKLLR
jgi:prephenate dehydrogenase